MLVGSMNGLLWCINMHAFSMHCDVNKPYKNQSFGIRQTTKLTKPRNCSAAGMQFPEYCLNVSSPRRFLPGRPSFLAIKLHISRAGAEQTILYRDVLRAGGLLPMLLACLRNLKGDPPSLANTETLQK